MSRTFYWFQKSFFLTLHNTNRADTRKEERERERENNYFRVPVIYTKNKKAVRKYQLINGHSLNNNKGRSTTPKTRPDETSSIAEIRHKSKPSLIPPNDAVARPQFHASRNSNPSKLVPLPRGQRTQ